MADYLSINEFPGNGSIMQIEVSFAGNNPDVGSGAVPYFKSGDVKAQFFTPATPTTPQIVEDKPLTYVGPNTFITQEIVPVGKVLRVYRETEDRFSLVNFVALQNVTERDLDALARQTVFLVEEAKDAAQFAINTAREAIKYSTSATSVAEQASTLALSADKNSTLAVTTANQANATANSAKQTAIAAADDAAAAEAHASNVEALAATAQEAATAAAELTVAAQTAATQAITTANGVDAKATDALSAATSANNAAQAALVIANGVDSKAEQAIINAANSLRIAEGAASTAEGIAATANDAVVTANAAVVTANAAKATADTQALRITNLTTDKVAEGTTNLYYTGNRVRLTTLSTFDRNNSPIATGDGFQVALGKLQAQVDATRTRLTKRNWIDNSSFIVNQRAASQTTPGSTDGPRPSGWYFLDRWKTSGAGSTNNVRLVGRPAPQQDKQIAITSGQICQVIASDTMPGGTYTLIHEGTATLTLQRSGVTVATLAGPGSITFTFPTAPVSALILFAAGGTVYHPQLIEGDQALPYEQTPYATEIVQCQRYFARIYGLGMNSPYAGSAGSAMSYRYPWPVQMVAFPTLVIIAPNMGAFQVKSWAADGASRSGFRLIMFSEGAAGFSIDMPAGDNLVNFIQGSCEP